MFHILIHVGRRSEYLSASYLYFDWDPDDIMNTLDLMNPYNASTEILSSFYQNICVDCSSSMAVDGVTEMRADKRPRSESMMGEEDSEGDEDTGEEEEEDLDDEDSESNESEDPEPDSLPSIDDVKGLIQGNVDHKDLILLPDGRPPLVEPYFQVEYWEDVLPEDLLQLWSRPWEADGRMDLPMENPFIPRQLQLLSTKSAPNGSLGEVDTPLYGARRTPLPEQVVDEDGLAVWHLIDVRFPVPKVEVYILLSSLAVSSAAGGRGWGAVHCDLLAMFLMDALSEQLYLAICAELNLSISSCAVGLQIHCHGFSDQALTLLNMVIDSVLNIDHLFHEGNIQILQRQKEVLGRQYQNIGLRAAPLAHDGRLHALKSNTSYGKEQKLLALSKTSLQSLSAFLKSFLSGYCMRVLVYGNMTAADAKVIPSFFESSSQSQLERSWANDLVEPVTSIPLNSMLAVIQQPSCPSESNLSVELYFQRDLYTLSDITYLDLLEQILVEPYFNEIRTKQQVGSASFFHEVLHSDDLIPIPDMYVCVCVSRLAMTSVAALN